jgi:hypothetical protein
MLAASPMSVRVILAVVLCMAAVSAFANANQEFAAEVRAHRAEMAHNESVVAQAAQLCASLPANREMEEPRCVAVRLHLRALAARDRHDLCETGSYTIGRMARCLLGGLAGSAA